jgi:hypothetical protein
MIWNHKVGLDSGGGRWLAGSHDQDSSWGCLLPVSSQGRHDGDMRGANYSQLHSARPKALFIFRRVQRAKIALRVLMVARSGDFATWMHVEA